MAEESQYSTNDFLRNHEVAAKLRDLRDFLIIAGYDESHASRYSHISSSIERLAQPIEVVRKEGRLQDIPGVGGLVASYIKEILDTGTCTKFKEWEDAAPLTVLDLVKIPGVGAKTARRLFQEFGIDSGPALRKALDDGRLNNVAGFGLKTLANMRDHV